MAPVSQGYCKMESIMSGYMTLYELAIANDHIAIVSENRRRAQEKQ